jgi:Rps23 Pro-64 3,4-dihydroxylase Tpa1-like proline 4-hydroxylase
MNAQRIFRPDLFDTAHTAKLLSLFNSNQPIRHLVIDQFLEPAFARSLFEHFPPVEEMRTHYKGLNEKKAEHSDFSKLDAGFSVLHEQLVSAEWTGQLEKLTGIEQLETIEDRLGYGLHQGADQSFLDIHIDYNLHPIKKLYRKLNLIIFLQDNWNDSWGGHLELWDREVKNCIQRITPTFNRCVIFECSDISYHGYSRIHVPGGVTRKSAYQYYFIPVSESIAFHDTIFKPRPEESAVKKLRTYSKDLVKNTAKKIMLRLGMKKFLK